MFKPPPSYAQLIRKKRESKGWTQAELAKQLGVTNVTVSRWEKERVTPSVELWTEFQST